MELLKDEKLRDVVPFLAGLEGGILKNSNSEKVVQLYSLLWIRGKSTIDFKSILQYDVRNKFSVTNLSMDCSFCQLMFEYQNEVLEFCHDKNDKLLFKFHRMTPYEVSAMVFMLKNLLRWSNWLFSEISVYSGSCDERLSKVLPAYMKRCDCVHIEFLDDKDWNYELMKVVPFLKKVAIHVKYYNFGFAVDCIGNAILNADECKLQHLTYTVNDCDYDIFKFPEDIINSILKLCHVLEAVNVSFTDDGDLFQEDIKLRWSDLAYLMTNDVNKSISEGSMGKLQYFGIHLRIRY